MEKELIFEYTLNGDTVKFYDDGTYIVSGRTICRYKIVGDEFHCQLEGSEDTWTIVRPNGDYPQFMTEVFPKLQTAILERVIWEEK